jgi:hypothetical protein
VDYDLERKRLRADILTAKLRADANVSAPILPLFHQRQSKHCVRNPFCGVYTIRVITESDHESHSIYSWELITWRLNLAELKGAEKVRVRLGVRGRDGHW